MERDTLSSSAEQALTDYEKYLRQKLDLSAATIRGYLGDIRQFMLWCERTFSAGQETPTPFTPQAIATPTITRYRSYLQSTMRLKPATINRYLISLKRYFSWAMDAALIQHDPARVVKLVNQEVATPRHLSDTEESALMAAVMNGNNPRDKTMITLMLHTGLRAGEVCTLKRVDVHIGDKTGSLRVCGKRNKYRTIPLNATARATLRDYLHDFLPSDAEYVFLAQRTGQPMTERSLGRIVKDYGMKARIADLSPHDLRHRFAYRLAEGNKISLHRIAELLGHDSLDTTRIYIQSTQTDLQKVVEEIAWE